LGNVAAIVQNPETTEGTCINNIQWGRFYSLKRFNPRATSCRAVLLQPCLLVSKAAFAATQTTRGSNTGHHNTYAGRLYPRILLLGRVHAEIAANHGLAGMQESRHLHPGQAWNQPQIHLATLLLAPDTAQVVVIQRIARQS